MNVCLTVKRFISDKGQSQPPELTLPAKLWLQLNESDLKPCQPTQEFRHTAEVVGLGSCAEQTKKASYQIQSIWIYFSLDGEEIRFQEPDTKGLEAIRDVDVPPPRAVKVAKATGRMSMKRPAVAALKRPAVALRTSNSGTVEPEAGSSGAAHDAAPWADDARPSLANDAPGAGPVPSARGAAAAAALHSPKPCPASKSKMKAPAPAVRIRPASSEAGPSEPVTVDDIKVLPSFYALVVGSAVQRKHPKFDAQSAEIRLRESVGGFRKHPDG